jgi:signal transduction histidine kinase
MLAACFAERERLAREIHDTLAQNFISILTLSQATEAALPRDATTARKRLALIERTTREGLAEAKALVGALGPVAYWTPAWPRQCSESWPDSAMKPDFRPGSR